MKTKDIIDAWSRIRTTDNVIPDDVLDFMKDAAIEKIEQDKKRAHPQLCVPEWDEPLIWTNECEIDGQRFHYDVCSSNSLEEGRAFYGEKYEYIGSSYITYHNGRRNEWKNLHHFFIHAYAEIA
jgi:hypothetical protein